MDWNDPDELRRLRDLLGRGPDAGHHGRGPARTGHRHGRDDRRAASGMPELGGSYFTFSNENNDLIWGFLAEVPPTRLALQGHRLDAVVRALRHRHEPDGDERGLPGPRGPGPDRALPARGPAGRVPPRLDDDALDADRNVAAAVGPDLDYVLVAPGRGALLGRQGHAQDARSRGRSRCSRSARARTSSAGATAGPFDDLAAVARPRSRPASTSEGASAVRATASSPGTTSARTRAPASSTSRPAAAPRTSSWASSSACRSSRRSTRSGHYLRGLRAVQRHWTRRASRGEIIEALQAARLLLPPRAVHAPLSALLALRDGAALPRRGRVVHLDGPGLRRAPRAGDARTEGGQPALPDHGRRRPDPLDPGLRLRARARLAAHDVRLDDLEEALLGPGAADLGVRRRARRFEVIGGREELASARGRGFEAARGTHAASAVGRRGHARLPRLRRRDARASATSATPGSTPASCRSARCTTATDPDYWQKWFPADFITESFPGQFRNWFYSMLAMSTVLRSEPPFLTIFGYATLFGEDGRPDAQELGQRDRVQRGGRAHGRRRHALDVLRGSGPRTTSSSATTPPTRRGGSCWCCGTCWPSSRTYARLTGWQPAAPVLGAQAADPRPQPARPLDPVARGGARPRRRRRASPTTTRAAATLRDQRVRRRPLDVVAAAQPPPPVAQRRRARPRRGLRDAAPRARRAWRGCWRRSCPSSPRRCTRCSSCRSSRTRPTPCT